MGSKDARQTARLVFQSRVLDSLHVLIKVVFLLGIQVRLALQIALFFKNAIQFDRFLPFLLAGLQAW